MDKTPISIALERQIPEYIRGEYELFVDFIKAYYKFLDQTQQRDLEDIRSIQNTLDEFVIKFKKELSFLFPTNSVQNERFILERIKEFYKARGSKESYQFLFRILFNKDSEVFYPSTQILRASDGKWIQEKSVFIKRVSGDIFNLSGKIIKIKTAQKEIFVFCQRVVLYREDVYEVFIEKSYTQDITIDDVVCSEDNNDSGTILPCPAKYKIVTAGSGFEAGQLYYLKTESGDGSLIKITKIGANGSIKKIQVISFGLDYKSTFYAQLSNKQAISLQYRHPVPGPYPDRTTGFVDLGYINKQDYFYYDENYIPTVAPNENVFYADGTYVGEIIGSFYTNASLSNVIDESTAEIKIELGPVAIYPGYYQTSDGFISDESYIQDGKYYQLFSYVIKVEQQIDTYSDIVKTLLHPAGMEMYAQYTIKNNYVVAASPLLAYIRRQFLEQEYVTDDEGTNSVYLNKEDVVTAVHNFLNDIKNVELSIQKYRSDGSLANETDERRWSTVDPTTANFYDDSKVIPTTDSTYSTTDFRYNDVDQRSFDISNPLDVITNKDVVQLKIDSITSDSESGGRLFELASIVNGTFYQTTSASHLSSTDVKDAILGKDETPTPVDSFDRTVNFYRTLEDIGVSNEIYSSLFTPSTKADVSTIVGGEWLWDGSSYIQLYPEVRIGVGYIRSPELYSDLANNVTSAESFPDGSSGLVKFSFSGSTWTDTYSSVDLYADLLTASKADFVSSPIDELTTREYNPTYRESINNLNTGFLYVNAYNQNDALDVTTTYSYEAETYSVHDTRAIS